MSTSKDFLKKRAKAFAVAKKYLRYKHNICSMNCPGIKGMVKMLLPCLKIDNPNADIPNDDTPLSKRQCGELLIEWYGRGMFDVSLGAPPSDKPLTVFKARHFRKIRVRKHMPQKKYGGKDGFYLSREWRELRYQALKMYGRKCMVCNASAESGAVMHVDHIKPRSIYPELELELSNLQILCEDCNLGKCNHDDIDWRPTSAVST